MIEKNNYLKVKSFKLGRNDYVRFLLTKTAGLPLLKTINHL